MYTKIKPICKNCKSHLNGYVCEVSGKLTFPDSVCAFSNMCSVAFNPIIKLSDITPICKNCDLFFNGYLCEGCGKYTSADDKCKCGVGQSLAFVPSQSAIDAAIRQAKQR